MKVLGIGNALLDILFRLEDDNALIKIGIQKGAMDLIEERQMMAIQEKLSGLSRTEAPGGAACNTIRAMARLGAEVGYIGKVGRDANGALYENALHKAGVTPHIVHSESASGCSTVMISPDGERSMATFLGAAATLSAVEIPATVIPGYDYIYIEGYLISNGELFLPVLQRAKEAGLKIALDLSNFNIVNAFKPLLSEVIPQYVDVLFSNESEAEAYTGVDAEKAVRKIAEQAEIAVVTVGAKGVYMCSHGETLHLEAKGKNPVDTTGAGDHFAAGFLYGLTRQAPLVSAAEIGSLLSAKVIETVGSQIPDGVWPEIMLKVEEIVRPSLKK
ncbi:MAG: adenosine kinase [Tannerella sp.]|jgi:sugar/nucleoside kinase (ribokinase family)|nr:adenosine kinase [Tannerella sp.]